MRKGKKEVEDAGKELRYTQQVVAGELAGWQDSHERMGRNAIRELVKGMVVREKATLEGMKRTLRRLQGKEATEFSLGSPVTPGLLSPVSPMGSVSPIESAIEGSMGMGVARNPSLLDRQCV